MRLPQSPNWLSHPRILVVGCAALLLVATLLHFARPFGEGSDPEASLSAETARKDTAPTAATQFRIASFNLLGAGHTKPGGDRRGWASGTQRMVWSVQLIRQQNLDLIGFQEMQDPQFRKFQALTGDQYGIYPGDQLGPAAMHNSIAWRRDTWEKVALKWVHIPYFHGDKIRMPYILLRNTKTDQLAWFANFHNPANARGDASKWRKKATDIQIALANRLRKDYPGVPVHFTGDFNDRQGYYCPVATRTELRSANGGHVSGTKCNPPKVMPVDWIFGTAPTKFTGYVALRSALVRKSTDHPLVMADASIPPSDSRSAGVRKVVVISVEGLRSSMIDRLVAAKSPGIPFLMKQGTSTTDARTVYTRTTQLPNAVSMLTGRSVTAKYGGHGVAKERDTGSTIHQAAGHYVSSVFDMVHDFGYQTALYAQDPDMAMVRRSYDARHGAIDREGKDNGRNKINTYVQKSNSTQLVRAVRKQLKTSPRKFTYVQLNDLDVVGHKYGFMSKKYKAEALKVDQLIKKIRFTINLSKKLRGKTMVIVTSEHGGHRKKHNDASLLRNIRVPFVVWGPSISGGTDLYALNPSLSRPGHSRPGYNEPQPVRNSYVANLVMSALLLPSVPGSNMSRAQTVNIFDGP